MQQHVEVQAIGLHGRAAAPHALAPDREQGLERGIDQQQRREHRRHLRMRMHQFRCDERDQRAQQIRAAVAEEDAAARKIPGEEACDARRATQRDRRKRRIADHCAHQGERAQGEQRVKAGEAVVAVDEVQRVRRATDE
ncbi:MAG TPA: hypothetical protein VM240_04805 [Verrucomicrobiae bacterium]|nr:hypothetical protein [Verrucomicrobiae bacterium]